MLQLLADGGKCIAIAEESRDVQFDGSDSSLGIVGYRPSGEPVGCVSLEKH